MAPAPVRKLMQLKFGPLPDAVEAAIGSASLEQLDRWLGRVWSLDIALQALRDSLRKRRVRPAGVTLTLLVPRT